MTLHEVEWLIALGALVLAVLATRFDVSPWRIFAVALATHMAGEPCAVLHQTGVGNRLFDYTIVSSLTLYAAAALTGIVDGIRLGKAGDRDTAVSRAVGIPIVSAMGVGIVFFAFLYGISPCLD